MPVFIQGKQQQLRWTLLLVVAALLVSAMIVALPAPAVAQAPLGVSWTAFYWNNRTFAGNPTIGRTDPAINFNWATGSPDPAIPSDGFSARWTASVNIQTAGSYLLRAGADDGIRVAIDGQIVIDRFTEASAFTLVTLNVNLGTGIRNFVVDYFEAGGNAGVLFEIIPGGVAINPIPGQPTPTFAGAPGVVPTTDPGFVKAEVIVLRANLRSGPGTQFPQIGEAAKGQTFRVLAKNGDFGMETWFLIDLGDASRAWIYRRNVYVYGGVPDALPKTQEVVGGAAAGAETGATVIQVTGLARADVVVRDIPSQRSGQRIGVINRGQSFLVLQLSRNRAWIKVNYNGLVGWVYLPNVRITSGRLGSLPRGDN
jgi:uncharacterized protein YraI